MAAGDLTTLANVKSWLGITSSGDDALLSRLITAASQQIQTWCGRTFASASYSEKRDGPGTPDANKQTLMFSNIPVTAVSSVVISGVTVPASADNGLVQSGYGFDDRMLWLIGYTFVAGKRNVRISYTAGYASTPADVEQACIAMVGLEYKTRERIGLRSKSLAGESISFFNSALSNSSSGELSPIAAMLAPYRKVIPV